MRIAAVIVAFFAGTGLAGLAGALARGAVSPGVAWFALAAGLVLALLAARDTAVQPARKWGVADWLVATAFTLFALRAFLWVAYRDGEAIRFSSAYNLGDLSLHLTYINHMAAGAPFWPDNPIFAGQPVRYPLGVDFLNALLVAVGVDVLRSLVWVGLLGSLAALLALHRWGGAFAVAAFLFNGGLAGFDFFRTLQPSDYQADMAWKSIPLTMFVTQRGLLFAIPAGLLLLHSWRLRFFPGEDPAARPLPAWLEVLLYAALPLFHVHTFLFFSLMLAAWVAVVGRDQRAALVRAVAVAFLPAAALMLLVTGLFQTPSMIHLKPGWMQEEGGLGGFAAFWLINFGVLPLLVIPLVIRVVGDFGISRRAAAFVMPALGIFVGACFVMLAPWEWDNTKIMIWCYLAILPFLWQDVIAPLPVWSRASICFLLFFSGGVTLLGGLGPAVFGYGLAERPELDAVVKATRPLPLTATFAAAPVCNHPLLLAGRKVAVGYPGHLWSHGIDYLPRQAALRTLMTGQPGWREAVAATGANYIFWGRREEVEFPDSHRPWRSVCPLVAHGDWGDIYDLAPLRAGR